MHKCKLASKRENLLFLERFCKNPDKRVSIIKHFHVAIEAYEELPPWHRVYNATGSDILLKDSIIMLRISDLQKRICYYPVFSEKLGAKLIAKWGYELPPKLTAFAHDEDDERGVHRENSSFRHLLAFARMFMLPQSHTHAPMTFAFNNLYQQLHAFPNNGVGSETIKLVNEILGDFIKNHKEGYFVDYENLQDFITNLLKDYTLLAFKNSDFSVLRKKLLLDYPNDKVYF